MICRPLLRYHKQDLMDFCRASNVSWVEDETNRDVWRTTRNTARALLESSKLPRALQRHSLLEVSNHVRLKGQNHSLMANHLRAQCKIVIFDLRSGRLVVRLPKHWRVGELVKGTGTGRYSGLLTTSILVRLLAASVTPQEEILLHSLRSAVVALFPDLEAATIADSGQLGNPLTFTLAGILFERLPARIEPAVDVPSPNLGQNWKKNNDDLDPDFVWSLTRQPFRKTEVRADAKSLSKTLTSIIFPPNSSSKKNGSLGPQYRSPWHLWDGRYWIRVKNDTDQPLEVRPFTTADLHAIRMSLPRSKVRSLEVALADAAPNKVRWTLPIISYATEKGSTPGRPLGLPSLGQIGRLVADEEFGEQVLDWEIRYKSCPLSQRRPKDFKLDGNMVTCWMDPWVKTSKVCQPTEREAGKQP